MPFITTRGSSTASGTGFNFFELPSAEDLLQPELNMWFKEGTDSNWETQANWFLDVAQSTPATGLPKSYTNVILLTDAYVEMYGPNAGNFANTIELGSTVDVNGFTLYITGHPSVETEEWLELTDEEKDANDDTENPVVQYSCASGVTVDISGITDSKESTRARDENGELVYALVMQSGHITVILA